MSKQKEFYDGLCELVDELNVLEDNLSYYLDEDDCDEDLTYDKLTEILYDKYAFQHEFIYYRSAMEYLLKEDDTLEEAFEYASNFGYDVKDLNSCLLASILAEERARDEWAENESEITNYIDDFDWDEEDEQEEDEE